MRQPVKYSHNSAGVLAPFKRNKPEKHKIILKKFLSKKYFLRAAKPDKIQILRQMESSSNNTQCSTIVCHRSLFT